MIAAVTVALVQLLTAPVEVVYHADLEGQMAVPRCGEPVAEEPDYAAQVAVIRDVRQAAADRGAPPPIVLLGGDQIAPDLFVRGILKRDGEAGARDIAAAFARAGYDAITLGNHELAIDRVRLERFASAAAAAGLPIVVSNLTCDAARQPFCRHVRREVLLDRGGQKIGVLAIASPRMLATIAKAQLEGLELEDPAKAILAGTARLRAAGASAVLVMLQVSSGRGGVEEVLTLQRALPTQGAPDLLLSSSLSDADGQRPTLLIRQEGSPAVVGSASGPRAVTHVTLEPREGALHVDAVDRRARLDRRDDETTRLLAPHVATFCERYAVPLGPAGTKIPTTKPELLAYVLDVLQRETHAELAFVNTGLVYGRAFPLRGRWTRAALKRALPHAATAGTLTVHGSTLADLLAVGEASGRLAMVGAARPEPGKPFLINGRPIDKSRGYRIATVDFVARGGDASFAKNELAAWRPWRGTPDLRDLVEAALVRGATFETPASERLLTSAIGDLIADLTNTSIDNDAGLADTQLARAEQRAIKLELVALLQLDHPLHRWDSRLNVKYGYASTRPAGMPAAAQETLDLVQLSSLYSYRGLTHGKTDAKFVPNPYSRLLLESELTVPDTRTYRHAELTQTVGALFTPRPKLKLRGGAGYRTQLVADGDSPDPIEAQVGGFRFVAEAGATLDPFPLATFGKLSVTAEGLVDYFLIAPTGRTEHQLRASGKLSLPLLPLLFLTAGLDVFAVDREGAGRGVSFDATFGLKLHLDKTHQSL